MKTTFINQVRKKSIFIVWNHIYRAKSNKQLKDIKSDFIEVDQMLSTIVHIFKDGLNRFGR